MMNYELLAEGYSQELKATRKIIETVTILGKGLDAQNEALMLLRDDHTEYAEMVRAMLDYYHYMVYYADEEETS